MGIRITTWNVNGIRNPFGYQPWRENRTFNSMFDILEADIVVMQELKIQRKDLRDDMVLVPGWDCYFSLPKHKKGYSGVGIYTRQSVCAPIRAEEGLLGVLCPPDSSTPYRDLPEDQHIGGYPTVLQVSDLGVDPAALDAEGRCVALEFPAFVLFGVYSPANSNGLRDDFRYGFITALDTRIRNLEKMGKRVILTGDLNVSREEIDTAKAEENMVKEGITREDYFNSPNRRLFNQLLEGGKVYGERDEGREKPVLWDTCREFHPKREGMYTHWEQKINARPGNFGSRIDFILCSIEMKSWYSDANIQEGLMGSDHCPVYAIMKDEVDVQGEQLSILDIMNPPGMFKNGKRIKEYGTKDLLAFSAKLLPEFDKRRSIKDMFNRKSPLITSRSTQYSTPELSRTASSSDINAFASVVDVAPVPPAASTKRPPAGSPIRSPEKRRAKELSGIAPAKRSKSNPKISSASSLSKGQQSLKGFFQPKTTPPNSDGTSTASKLSPELEASQGKETLPDMTGTSHKGFVPSLIPSTPPNAVQQNGQGAEAMISTKSVSRSPLRRVSSITSDIDDERFIDPIVSKESWNMLFTKKPPPRCEGHEEPCISLSTKKPGVNCGRQFWICPRPIGPSGQKERGTQWRCGTFIWASDWASPNRS